MGYDKDWEVHQALNDPNDPIHGYIEAQLPNKANSENWVWTCEQCDFSTASEQDALTHSDEQKHSLGLAPAKKFLGIPERWLDDPTWLCENNHVSKRYLKSEEHGDLCLACGKPVRLCDPETQENQDTDV